jgi:hypothetical protein
LDFYSTTSQKQQSVGKRHVLWRSSEYQLYNLEVNTLTISPPMWFFPVGDKEIPLFKTTQDLK